MAETFSPDLSSSGRVEMFSAIPVCRASGMVTDGCDHLCFCVPLLGSSQCVPLPPFLHRLMLLRISIHPKGLTPFQAAKAWHLRHVQKLPWAAVREQVRTSERAPSPVRRGGCGAADQRAAPHRRLSPDRDSNHGILALRAQAASESAAKSSHRHLCHALAEQAFLVWCDVM